MADAASASNRILFDFGGGREAQRVAGQPARIVGAQLRDDVTDDWNGAGRHAELRQAEPDQQPDQRRIGRHLAAERDRDAMSRRAARRTSRISRSTAGCSGS